MKKMIKQLFCDHEILTKTETSYPPPALIIKTVIQCTKCKKTFPIRPDMNCCHVQHIQHEIVQEYFYSQFNNGKQGNKNDNR